MLPELRVDPIRFAEFFEIEWEAARRQWEKEPDKVPQDAASLTEFMVGKNRRYEQGDFGILGKVGRHFPHIRIESEMFRTDQTWHFCYDPGEGKFDDSLESKAP